MAEVLITLAIIGVVAALTMPSLIAKYDEKVKITKLKKLYTTLSNAYELVLQEHGTCKSWYDNENTPEGNFAASQRMYELFQPYLKVQKECGQTGCWPNVMYKWVNGADYQNLSKNSAIYELMLADGSMVFFYSYGTAGRNLGVWPAYETCGAISVDLNGAKGPNVVNKDRFLFIVHLNSIYPNGTKMQIGDDISPKCRAEVGCTAWVIYNENIDYLHCDDLSWSGKTKCD